MQIDTKNIKAIIFDLGGVLIPLDWPSAELCFEKHGAIFTPQSYELLTHLAERFNAGRIEAPDFRREFSQAIGIKLDDNEFDQCWNSLVLYLPEENMELIQGLKKDYDIYILSNINPIHHEHIKRFSTWNEGLFKDIFLSYKLKTRKPELEIFEKVLEKIPYKPEEILFFDDKPENTEAASSLGIQAIIVSRDIKDIVNETLKISVLR